MEGSQKTNIYEGLPRKYGLGQFVDLREGLAKKRGCFGGGVDTAMHTMKIPDFGTFSEMRIFPKNQALWRYTFIYMHNI